MNPTLLHEPRGQDPRAPQRPPVAGRHLPMTAQEMEERGWDAVDVVFVSGDAYVDHPSFAMAILGRVLEASGYRVGLVCQPDWRSADPWRVFGKPRLFFGVSGGNMDSMINHYTANRKVRNDDAYSPGGRIGLRPDRATLAYCQRAREAFPGTPVIAGGVEASLRRLAHYDYWSDQVRRSILLDSKADLVVYGMGERQIVEIARRLAAGASVKDLRDLRGVAYALGGQEAPPSGPGVAELPSYEAVVADKRAFSEATRLIHHETSPFNARTLVQWHGTRGEGGRAVIQTPPDLPLSRDEMDHIYDLPYTRRPHPSYREKIPAHTMVKDSVTILRGCFGGCTFCSITAHQGRTIQSRSQESILREIETMASDPKFKGTVSDIGGPTANMFEMRCQRPEVEAVCRRLSCVHPKICPLLGTDHGPLLEVMRGSRQVPGVKKVLVSSGIRMDLARLSPEYVRELAAHHVGGYLKVAPEHTDPNVLNLMKKPGISDFTAFEREFEATSRAHGKEQFLIPYYIASHPGSDLGAMIDLALFLKRTGYRPDQVQDFIPAPMDVATSMYHTGLDPMSGKPVVVARKMRERKFQRALLQFFKPENYFEVRRALLEAGRADLIGEGCDALIPSRPPRAAIEARRRQAKEELGGVPGEGKPKPGPGGGARRSEGGRREGSGAGYRPHRKSARRRSRGAADP